MNKQAFIPIDLFNSKGRFITQTVPSHLQPFYFTFPLCSPNAGKYTKIYAKTPEEAKELMDCFYGCDKWAFQYNLSDWTDEDGKTIAEQYNLSEIEIKPLSKD